MKTPSCVMNNLSANSQPLSLLTQSQNSNYIHRTILNENVITQTSYKCLLYSIDIDIVSSSGSAFSPCYFVSTQLFENESYAQ